MLRITAGPYAFAARLEEELAPKTCAAIRRLLPLRSKLVHCRWSGESTWVPMGERRLGVDPENHTSHPAPGQLLVYVFAQWTDPTYGIVEQEKYVTPTLSHRYEVLHLPEQGAYQFTYDTVPWLTTLPNQGWYPTEVQVFSESQDRGDHFPGSIGYEALYANGQKFINGSWANLTLTSQIQSLWGSEVAGLFWWSGNSFDTWDKRCSDAS